MMYFAFLVCSPAGRYTSFYMQVLFKNLMYYEIALNLAAPLSALGTSKSGPRNAGSSRLIFEQIFNYTQ